MKITSTHECYYAWNGERREWRYADKDRPGAMCYDCRRPYNAFGDMELSNDVWEQINPTHHEGAGLLCPNCIMERLSIVNISGITAKLHSPVSVDKLLGEMSALRKQLKECQELRRIEHKHGSVSTAQF